MPEHQVDVELLEAAARPAELQQAIVSQVNFKLCQTSVFDNDYAVAIFQDTRRHQDMEMQTEPTAGQRAVQMLLHDADIFPTICARHPDLLHKIMMINSKNY